MPTNTVEALEQSTTEKKIINPIFIDNSFPNEFDGKLFLALDLKDTKDVVLGIQLEELYNTPYPDLVYRVCESTGLDESTADAYLNFTINTIPKDRIR